MRRPVVRLVVGLLGLVAVVFGLAILTGGWLGFPPRRVIISRSVTVPPRVFVDGKPVEPEDGMSGGTMTMTQVISDGGEVTAAAFVVLGSGLVAFAAWPRRRAARAPS